MKKVLFLIASVAFACGQPVKSVETDAQLYGEAFDAATAIPVATLVSDVIATGEKTAVVEGTVAEVCQDGGCWMKVAVAETGDTVMVKTQHLFELPKDIAGRKVIFAGTGFADTMSVEVQQHYAKDAGKTEAEIAAITASKPAITFDATGVKVLK